MSTSANIKNILAEQIDGYRRLLELLHQEKACLQNLNASGVEGLSKEKDTLVLRLRLLEEERVRLTNKFSRDNKLSGDVNLQTLYETTKDETFQALKSQMISLVQSITELNQFNMILIERSINFVRNSAKFLELCGLNLHNKKTAIAFSREV